MTELARRAAASPPADFIDAAVGGVGLVPMFQPIVSLSDGMTVGSPLQSVTGVLGWSALRTPTLVS